MRLAILSGLAESALPFFAACKRDPVPRGRAMLLAQAAAIVGVRRRASELAGLLDLIASGPDEARRTSGLSVARLDDATFRTGRGAGTIRAATALTGRRRPPELEAVSGPARPALAGCGTVLPLRPADRRAPDGTGSPRTGPARPVRGDCPGLIAATQPREIQSAAARAVGRAGRPSLAARALDGWSDLAVATRRELLAALAGSSVLAQPLITALERSEIAASELDVSIRDAARASARARRCASEPRPSWPSLAPPQRSDVIGRYQAALKLVGDESIAELPCSPETARRATSARERATASAPIFRESPAEPPRLF